MRKNEEFIVEIQNLGANGEGVAMVENLPIFVSFALPKEKVKIKILKVLKNYAFGKLLEVIKPSKQRVEPLCPVFSKCGGCNLQHISYYEQLKFKQSLVKNNLKKFGNIDFDVPLTIESKNQYGYRNKLQLPVQEIFVKENERLIKKNVVGFYAVNSNRIVPTNQCVLYEKWAQEIFCIVLKLLEKSGETAYNPTTKQGNIKHIVARFCDDKLMLSVVTKTDSLKGQDLLIKLLNEKFENYSLYQNINTKDNNVILGEKFVLLSGEQTQTMQNFGIEYEVSPQSFLQINKDIQDKIYSKVLENIETEAIVVDAYSGAGLLSSIMSKKAKKVYGIEIIKQATENANKLANQNNIKNMENICGDCEEKLPELVEKLKKDGQLTNSKLNIVLDPPRKGCDDKVLNAIEGVLPNKIIYISCNSATLARDLKILMQNQHYKLSLVQPFDMFPQTCHVETVAILNLK